MVVMLLRQSQQFSRVNVAVDDADVDDDDTIFCVVNNIVVKCILQVECVSDAAPDVQSLQFFLSLFMGGFSAAADENYFPTTYSMESVANVLYSMYAIVDVSDICSFMARQCCNYFSGGKLIFNTIKTKRQRLWN